MPTAKKHSHVGQRSLGIKTTTPVRWKRPPHQPRRFLHLHLDRPHTVNEPIPMGGHIRKQRPHSPHPPLDLATCPCHLRVRSLICRLSIVRAAISRTYRPDPYHLTCGRIYRHNQVLAHRHPHRLLHCPPSAVTRIVLL